MQPTLSCLKYQQNHCHVLSLKAEIQTPRSFAYLDACMFFISLFEFIRVCMYRDHIQQSMDQSGKVANRALVVS